MAFRSDFLERNLFFRVRVTCWTLKLPKIHFKLVFQKFQYGLSDNGIKSIEISIKKTRRLGKLARSCSENSASSGEDMLEGEVTHGSQQGRLTDTKVLK